MWRPAQAGRVGGVVVLALNPVGLASVIEAEHLVVEVQALDDQLETAAKSEAALRVDLDVAEEINVAEWAFDAPGGPVRVLVSEYACLVVVDRHIHRQRPAVVSGTDVKDIGGVIQQARLVAAAGNGGSLGS